MIKLNYAEYKDKVYACWLGKNIGGTLGGPYEGSKETLNVTGFITPPKEPLPNDDLDLQLLWLHAIRHEGAKDFNAEKLGAYWQSFVVQHWNEYGICQANMKSGLYPAIAGEYRNPWKHSNGAWIRTEIWATLAPACPDVAINYAKEDAKIDHGNGEGTHAAVFVAAMESAAFVISDPRQLIEIGLSKIPEDCRIAQTVRLVLKSYDEGKTAIETRNLVFDLNVDMGNDGWFQAPSNIGYVIIGLMYGEGDFKKSMLTAINCGDDTDCTAATIGSIMGLIYGTKVLPKDWVEHVSDNIVTITFARLFRVPKNCTQLTEWVVDFAPAVLIENATDVRIVEGKSQIEDGLYEKFCGRRKGFDIPWDKIDEIPCMQYKNALGNSFSVKFAGVSVVVTYVGEPEISTNEEKKIELRILNNATAFGNVPRNINVKVLMLPEGFSADFDEKNVYVPHFTGFSKLWVSDTIEINVKAGETVKATNRVLLEVSEQGRYNPVFIPIVFLAK